ncbi:MAG: hypothetical protein LLG08_04255 [Actinomycetia bacterium]|nr:hypothetical protein [Actinomycetes bacterium]
MMNKTNSGSRSAIDDIDRRALLRLPLSERRAYLKAQADAYAEEYNRSIDHEWLDANLARSWVRDS